MRTLLLHRGIILLAGLLLSLHTLLPHVHVSQSGQLSTISFGERSPSSRGLFDLLSGLVHGDLGQEHLENFTKDQSDLGIVKADLVTASAIFVAQPLVSNKEWSSQFLVSQESLPPIDAGLSLQHPLRGPPNLT